MNTKNKKFHFAAILVVALASLPAPARAETGLDSFGITNNVAASSTNTTAATTGAAVKIDNYEQVGLYFKGALTNSGTSAVTLIVARSVDGTTAETTPFLTWAITAAGTTPVTVYTNLPNTLVGSVPYLLVTSVGNANANPLTNAVFGVVKKRIGR